MTSTDGPAPWHHDHRFDAGNAGAERRTRIVVWITAAMMAIEIVGGLGFNSMALLADGLHMGSHVLAIGLTALAYAAARRYASDGRFAFGTWKIEILGGFASAVLLAAVAAMMAVGSVERILSPQPIQYREAIAVAIVGLLVNVLSAWLLGHRHDHEHDHGHDHAHGHAGHGHAHGHAAGGRTDATHADLNLRSAYLHVLADAVTSLLAIVALAGGWWLGWDWLDPVMGIVGAVLVAIWAAQLIRATSAVLLDREMDHPVVEEIREVVRDHGQAHGTRLTDLHVWRVGRAAYACTLTLVSRDAGLTPAAVRDWLAVHEEVAHATIEIHLESTAPLP